MLRRAALALLAALCAALAGTLHAAALVDGTIATADGERHYLLVRPSRAGDAPRPLVLVLHGHGGSARQVLGEGFGRAPLSLWRTIADRDEVLVVALDGTKGADGHHGWNDCRGDAPDNPRSDDVSFAKAVIARMLRDEHADPRRVYAIGMSNGGMMAFRLALQLEPPLAAFAAVSASMAANSVCGPAAWPVSALLIDGTADPLMPYSGGEVGFRRKKNRGAVIGAEASAAYWRRTDRLEAVAPAVQEIAHRGAAGDASRAMRTLWSDPDTGLAVELVRVDGGGHVEPSVTQGYGAFWLRVVGPQNRDFEAAEEAWAFFRGRRAVRR
jgi:polyhydroxybutyrate depolymerase